MQSFIDALHQRGYEVVGPRVRDGVVAYQSLRDAGDLPSGLRDAQSPGSYRLHDVGDARQFAWAVGAQGLRPWLFPPRESLWRVMRSGSQLSFEAVRTVPRRIAFLGARACDLAALDLLDRAFLGPGPLGFASPPRGEGSGERESAPDPAYRARREALFIVAVNCTHAAATCFCVSTGDGPGVNGPNASQGFDIALTELDDGFVAEAGSVTGRELLETLALEPAHAGQNALARESVLAAAKAQTRALPGRNLRDALFARLEHPRWDEVAARCLACGNCTQVCPTCFCHRHQDEGGSLSDHAEQVREWDSCFSEGHASMRGGHARPEIRHRYRQWLTHKLGGWHDQFGRSGCVGCGRCIVWCPVGIDITEEARAICAS
jgi:ferredoxin